MTGPEGCAPSNGHRDSWNHDQLVEGRKRLPSSGPPARIHLAGPRRTTPQQAASRALRGRGRPDSGTQGSTRHADSVGTDRRRVESWRRAPADPRVGLHASRPRHRRRRSSSARPDGRFVGPGRRSARVWLDGGADLADRRSTRPTRRLRVRRPERRGPARTWGHVLVSHDQGTPGRPCPCPDERVSRSSEVSADGRHGSPAWTVNQEIHYLPTDARRTWDQRRRAGRRRTPWRSRSRRRPCSRETSSHRLMALADLGSGSAAGGSSWTAPGNTFSQRECGRRARRHHPPWPDTTPDQGRCPDAGGVDGPRIHLVGVRPQRHVHRHRARLGRRRPVRVGGNPELDLVRRAATWTRSPVRRAATTVATSADVPSCRCSVSASTGRPTART
jgi:hypothetical protein